MLNTLVALSNVFQRRRSGRKSRLSTFQIHRQGCRRHFSSSSLFKMPVPPSIPDSKLAIKPGEEDGRADGKQVMVVMITTPGDEVAKDLATKLRRYNLSLV